ncbi:MAG: hypothetical protein ABIT10_01030 [Alteraurantiacibacter sp.]
MRRAIKPLVLAGVLLAAPLTAQEHQPPLASVEAWSLLGAPPAPLQGGRADLSRSHARSQATSFSGTPVPAGDFSLTTTLVYQNLADGDVAGIALRGSNGGWISLQLEQITPALLIAVRSHVPDGIDAHGRLRATTAVSGWHQGRVQLKIERRGDTLQFSHAAEGGEWERLGPVFADPIGGVGELGLFAVDGAER